jgi:hypothetical protein
MSISQLKLSGVEFVFIDCCGWVITLFSLVLINSIIVKNEKFKKDYFLNRNNNS